MKRREFITLVGGAATWPLAARAQQAGRMRRVGVLIQFSESDPEGQARIAAFGEELQKLGWSIGGNLQIDYRWAVSNEERARSAAAELLELTPDVISANSTLPLRAVQQATRTVPIVFTTIIEPIGQGFVASLAHPGGTTTGFSYLEVSIGGKWINFFPRRLLRESHVSPACSIRRGVPTAWGSPISPRRRPKDLECRMLRRRFLSPRRSSPLWQPSRVSQMEV